jgi:4-amino-4-deoxy-L-arabinose transferase-like glycosyltransferase
METPLTAGIILGLWQLVVYIDHRKFINIFFAALGAAIAFATKGWIGPVVMFVPAFFYILLNRKWDILASLKTWLFIPIFFLLISPVLYAYYVQFDLHPEKIIRGKSDRSGIHFILWDQLFERSSGFDQGKKGRNSDYFFLYHTFLWAFFPWSLFASLAVVFWFRRMFAKKKWNHPFNFAVTGFAFLLFFISFSNFKMPHYIIMLLPFAALFTAPYFRLIISSIRSLKWAYPVQVFFAISVISVTLLINYYFFPPQNMFVWIVGSALLIALICMLIKKYNNSGLKLLHLTVAFPLVFNFFMNYNFFPSLFNYQGGNQLAGLIKEKNINISHNDIMVLEHNAHSFEFYRQHIYPVVDQQTVVDRFNDLSDKYFLMNHYHADFFREHGFLVNDTASHVDHNVTTITLKFLNPQTRQTNDTLILAKLQRR